MKSIDAIFLLFVFRMLFDTNYLLYKSSIQMTFKKLIEIKTTKTCNLQIFYLFIRFKKYEIK